MKSAVIIGSGLGGLSCGIILARNGYKVTVLEQAPQAGGCLQCFNRHGVKFETGMHFIGSADEGQTMDRFMRFLGIRESITLSRLDPKGYDVVSLCGSEFRFANGRDAFIEQMATDFPNQKDSIARYFDLMEQVASSSPFHSSPAVAGGSTNTGHAHNPASTISSFTEYQLLSMNSVIESIVADPLLANVLAGTLPLYAAERDKTPFSAHAFIMDFYNQSAWRIVGGSDALVNAMISNINDYGGKVLTRHKVVRIVCDDHHATGVVTANEQFFPADIVVSDAHPMRTLEFIDSKLIRPAFRQRINAIPQTCGGFSVYLEFKPGMVPYMNHNYYGYNTDTPWGCENYDEDSWPKGFLYMHSCHEANPRFARSGVILSYMQMSDVEQWEGTTVGHRGADYEALKLRKALKLIDAVERHIPGFKDGIQRFHTSTPLTYRDYTGTEGGSMYGIAKDVNMGAACRVPHRTRIPNVFQTGQNINSHGMLGVTVGTIVTCNEIVGPLSLPPTVPPSDRP